MNFVASVSSHALDKFFLLSEIEQIADLIFLEKSIKKSNSHHSNTDNCDPFVVYYTSWDPNPEKDIKLFDESLLKISVHANSFCSCLRNCMLSVEVQISSEIEQNVIRNKFNDISS